MPPPLTIDQLRTRAATGEAFSYLCFWGHRPRRDGAPSNACFSQWYEASFELDGIRYPTAEHYMMAEKARLFGDLDALARVLASRSPGAAKAHGREVVGFDEATWSRHRFDIVVQGNLAKFGQDERLAGFLCSTEDKVLVEASPMDSIWGIGLAADAPGIQDPAAWEGLNLLGFALMAVREHLFCR